MLRDVTVVETLAVDGIGSPVIVEGRRRMHAGKHLICDRRRSYCCRR